MKEKIRPIYSELQGYLKQAPSEAGSTQTLFTTSVWEHFNQSVDELNEISAKDYNRFKIIPIKGSGGNFTTATIYRQRLGGLIARLHGEYFSEEQAPFAGMPNTVIQQTQQQNQSVDIQMLLAVQSKIDEQLSKFPEGSKERTFLQKLKSSLTSVKDVTQLLSQLITTAKNLGLSVDDLSEVLGVVL